jgi:transposase
MDNLISSDNSTVFSEGLVSSGDTEFVAIRHNAPIKALYAHLKSKGKVSKVAIIACMRKLVTILNLLVKTNQLWEAK